MTFTGTQWEDGGECTVQAGPFLIRCHGEWRDYVYGVDVDIFDRPISDRLRNALAGALYQPALEDR